MSQKLLQKADEALWIRREMSYTLHYTVQMTQEAELLFYIYLKRDILIRTVLNPQYNPNIPLLDTLKKLLLACLIAIAVARCAHMQTFFISCCDVMQKSHRGSAGLFLSVTQAYCAQRFLETLMSLAHIVPSHKAQPPAPGTRSSRRLGRPL